ncbi:hypothetical protein [Actinosynnema sp. NPDC023587]
MLGQETDTDPLPAEALSALRIDPDDIAAADSFAGWRADVPALLKAYRG